MTYSYSEPMVYGAVQNNVYHNDMTNNKSSAVTAAVAGGILGGGVGAIAGCFKKNNPLKDGAISDTFTKSVYEKHIEGADDAVKKAYKDGLNILNKIDKVNNVEGLKKLFNENSDGAKGICSEIGQTPDEFLNNVTEKNLIENKKVIKDKINAGNNTRYRDLKNKIESCWDKDKKTFVKNEHISDELFNTIKKTTRKINGKTVAICAAIGAVITGAISYVGVKLLSKKSS